MSIHRGKRRVTEKLLNKNDADENSPNKEDEK